MRALDRLARKHSFDDEAAKRTFPKVFLEELTQEVEKVSEKIAKKHGFTLIKGTLES
jgi:hypothetical protein